MIHNILNMQLIPALPFPFVIVPLIVILLVGAAALWRLLR